MTTSAPHISGSPRPATARHGYALPMVLGLSLVVSGVAAVMLQREAALRLSVQHQLDSYRNHHVQQGVREVLNGWVLSLNGQPISKLIDEDGHVLDIESPGGVAKVYLFDGQGSVLGTMAGLTGDDRALAGRIVEQLLDISRGSLDPAWVRFLPPMAISLSAAPRQVIEAAVRVAADQKAASLFAREILASRDKGPLTEADITKATTAAGLDTKQAESIKKLFRLTPELWRVRVDVVERRGGRRERLLVRYEAHFSFSQDRTGQMAAGLQSLGAFQDWQEVPVE